MKYLSMWKLILLIFNLTYIESLRLKFKTQIKGAPASPTGLQVLLGEVPFLCVFCTISTFLPAPVPCELHIITGIRVAPRCLSSVFQEKVLPKPSKKKRERQTDRQRVV